MPLDSDELEELKSAVAVARKRDLNFALCLGKKSEGTVMLTHRIKGPEILGKQAKKAGETAKLAFGIMRVKGKNMMLTCHNDPPGGCARKAKEFMAKTVGLKMKVQILDINGQTLEEDGEEDENTVSEETGDTANTDEAKWREAYEKLDPVVAKAASSGLGDPSKLRAVWNYTTGIADEGDYTGALKIIPKVTALVKLATDATGASDTAKQGPSPEAERWDKLHPQVIKLYEQAMALGPENRSSLTAIWGMAIERAEAGNHKAALKVVDNLVPALRKAIEESADTNGNREAEATIPKDVVPFQKARVLWASSRAKMKTEMRKLEDAIIVVCRGDEEMDVLADEARDLSKRLEVFDSRLEDTLDEITNSAAGATREQLKKQAKQQITEYATALQDNFFKELDNDNGFANVAVAATARQSLSAISKTLG